jgi:Domain of unknown function (DUF4184)
MPFTLSHPAAAVVFWPLVRRKQLPLSALAIGSMLPDFEFFIHLRPIDLWGHSLIGFVTFCLPVGLLALAAWEFLARDAVLHLLAMPVHENPNTRTWQWWTRAVVAIAIGVALPALGSTAFPLRDRPITWAVLADYVSTIVGGAVVLAWLGSVLRRANTFSVFVRSRWRWGVLSLLGGSAIAVGLWNGFRGPPSINYWTGEMWLARFSIGAMLGFAVALLAFGAAHRIGRRSIFAGA